MTNKRPITITHFETHGELALLCVHTSTANLPCLPALADVRFPTSLTGDGTDAMYAGITAQCNDMTTYPTSTGTQIVTTPLHMSFYIPLRRSSRAMAWHLRSGGGTILYVFYLWSPFVIIGRVKRFLNFVLVTSQVCSAIQAVASRLLNRDIEELFANMGKTWDYLVADPQLRW